MSRFRNTQTNIRVTVRVILIEFLPHSDTLLLFIPYLKTLGTALIVLK